MSSSGLWSACLLSALVASVQAQGDLEEPKAASLSERAEPEIEQLFQSRLDPARIREHLRAMSARPHHTGSDGAREVAEYVAGRFRSWGFETTIETYYALVSLPRENVVELLEPRRYRATPLEPFIPGYTPEHVADSLPPFAAYSSDGEVTAEAVYVNYGLPEDYALLAQRSVDVRDKIVIARFGGAFRGVKPRLAHKHGALGLVLFSDPADSGHAKGPVYPEGRFLPRFGYERGSFLDLPQRTGDPLTPGRAVATQPETFSLEDAAAVISPIPVIPLSASDVQPVLEAMTGPAAPGEWQGALPLTYRIVGPLRMWMKVVQEWKVVPLHNVVARLTGSRWPDEWLLRGNNHDAWNYGAEDALSGLSAMLEEARSISELTKTGWRPKRTLVYLAWDGEEQGLLGSTEWVEAHASELKEKAIFYLNSGPVTPGHFWAGGSHSLEVLVNGVAKAVTDPRLDVPLFDRVAARTRMSGTEQARSDLLKFGRMRLDPLGVGSDWTPFLQHLGIPSLYISFEGEIENGIYHSIYDTFELYDRLGADAYEYLAKLAEVGGRLMLRAAEADILPFDFSGMAFALSTYVTELERLTKDALAPSSKGRQLTEEGHHPRLDGSEATHSAAQKPVRLDFAPLRSAAKKVQAAAARFSDAQRTMDLSDDSVRTETLHELNAVLFKAEQTLTKESGLPGRPWYRHHIYAPGTDSGYEAMTLPSVREAIEARRWDAAQKEIGEVAALIDAYAGEIDNARHILMQAKQSR